MKYSIYLIILSDVYYCTYVYIFDLQNFNKFFYILLCQQQKIS